MCQVEKKVNSPKFSTSHGSVTVSPITARTDCEREMNFGCTTGESTNSTSLRMSDEDNAFP
jgi:hypothetical protein